VAHCFGEVVGLGLRNIAQCPIEVNLVPKGIRSKQAFAQKKPYFLASITSVIIVIFAVGMFYNNTAQIKKEALSELNYRLKPLEHRFEELSKYEKEIQRATAEANALTASLKDRFFWPEALVQMRNLLLTVEEKATKPGKDVGVWIENFGAVEADPEEETTFTRNGEPPMGSLEWFRKYPDLGKRYFPQMYEALVKQGLLTSQPIIALKQQASNTNTLTINVRFRAVSRNTQEDPTADGQLVYAVADAFKNSNLFDPSGTRLESSMEEPERIGPKAATFRFNMVLKLKNEMQL
jgi:hypothetical protein